jgi:recombination protein RecA
LGLNLRVRQLSVEHALDLSYAKTLGVDIDKLLLSQPDCGEDALDLTEFLVRTGSIGCIVVDSIASLVPRAEIAGEMGDAHMGLQARLMSQGLRKLTGIARSNNCLLLFTNQIRMKIGVVYGNPETTTGGRAMKFYASIRVDIRSTGPIKVKEEPVATGVKMKVVKNKMAPPFKVCESRISYDGTGIDLYDELLFYAVQEGYIEKRGAWYTCEGENIGQGAEATKEFLKSNSELADRLMLTILEPEPDQEVIEVEETETQEQDYGIMTLEQLRKLKLSTEKGTPVWKALVKEIKKKKGE